MSCCGSPDQGYGAIGYLDNYGVAMHSNPMGSIVMTAALLGKIIGAGATIVGVGGGLLGGRQARKAQDAAVVAQERAQRERLEAEQRMAQQRSQLLFTLSLVGVGIFAVALTYKARTRNA